MPKLQDVRKEVEADPHSTPPSVIEFAKRMAPLMTAALASDQSAMELFPQLEECVRERDTVTSVQALCASNAERLAQKYPTDLKGRYQRLFDESSKEVQALLRAAETLQR